MTKASDNLFPGIILRESADDGSDFGNPTADYRRLFLGEDGQLHVKDSAGAVTDIGTAGGGDITTDAAWAAKGDIIVATGNDAAAVLSAGANGKVPTYASGEATGIKPEYPPGYEYNYTEFTAPVNVTATTEGAANTVVTAAAVDPAGADIWIEFFCPYARPTATATDNIRFVLYDGASSIGILGLKQTPAAANDNSPILLRRRLPAISGSKTYSVRSYVTAGTGVVTAGAGGSGNVMPGFIRITRA